MLPCAVIVGTQDMLLSRALNRGIRGQSRALADAVRVVTYRLPMGFRRNPVDGERAGDDGATRGFPTIAPSSRISCGKEFSPLPRRVDVGDAGTVLAGDGGLKNAPGDGEERTIRHRSGPLSNRVRAVIEPSFPVDDSFPPGTRRVQKLLKDIANRAKIPGLGPHVLRHTFATLFLQNGGSLAALETRL